MKKKTIRLTRLPLLGSVMLLGACHKEGISDSNVKPSTNTSASAGVANVATMRTSARTVVRIDLNDRLPAIDWLVILVSFSL